MSDVTEPTAPIPAVDAPTEQAPAGEPPERQPWTVSQLRTRLRALDRVGRGGKQVTARDVEVLVDDAAFTVGYEQLRRVRVEEELGRLKDDYRKLRTALWEASEHIKRLENPEGYGLTPTVAVAAVVGGRAFGENVVTNAQAEAERIMANAEEEARRMRATVRLELEAGDTPARPEMADSPLGAHILAVVRWLPQAITAAEGRVGQLEATLEAATEALPEAKRHVVELHEEKDGLVNVFPLAGSMLAGDTIDVTEVDVTEAAQAS